LAKSRGVKYRTAPYANWHYDLPALAQQINANTKIVYLANPNNPTGTIFTRRQFAEFYKHVPERVLIILDEAYFEYAKDNPLYPDSMHYRYDNVITLRTFSKIYGLAGARIGYGFAHEELIRNLLKVKLPFEPSTPAQAAGIAALQDKEFLHRSLEINARGLKYLTAGLEDMGLTVAPSERQLRDGRTAFGGGCRAHFRRTAGARRSGAPAEGVRLAELPPYIHRPRRRQPPLHRSIKENLCRKYWNKPRKLRRIFCRSTAPTTSSSTLATRARPRTTTARRSASGWRPIADPKPARARALLTC
jgi:hypothetical protein